MPDSRFIGLRLSRDVAHVSCGAMHILVNRRTGQWVKITDAAFQAVKICTRRISCDTSTGGRKSAWQLARFADLLDILSKKRFFERTEPNEEWETADQHRHRIRPAIAYFKITDRCNLHCLTCYIDAYHMSGRDPLNLMQIKCVLDELAKTGCQELVLTGGEPFLREDLFELLRHARSLFGKITLETNGTLINEEKAKQCADLVDLISIGVECGGASLHDSVRGVGSFSRTLCGAKHLQMNAANFEFVQVVMGPNEDRISQLATKLGATTRFCLFMPQGRGGTNVRKLPVDFDNLRCSSWEKDAFEKAAASISDAPAAARKGHKLKARTRCWAITGVISLASNADVYPCRFLHNQIFLLGNVLDQPMSAILTKDSRVVREVLSRTVDVVHVCKDCDVRYFCGGGCIARSYVDGGCIEARDPLCAWRRDSFRHMVWGAAKDV